MVFCCPPTEVEPVVGIDDSPIVEETIGKSFDVPVGTKKMFEVRGRKILVINDEGKFSAINGLCSHYNFSLETGIYSKGRIRCPLHGACFNVKNGDIEDFPGFDNVNAFQVKSVNGDLILTTTEKRLTSDRRTKKTKFSKTDDSPVVVIGSGPAAASFIESARKNGLTTPIVMVTSESTPPYDRVKLSKNPAVKASEIRFRDDDYYRDQGVEIKLKTTVAEVKPAHKLLTFSNGKSMTYSKLVIATGGLVRKFELPGNDLKNIFYLRTLEDANAIAEATTGKNVVCIGASFIGMEIASALASKAASVTVISVTPEPLPAFGQDVGEAIRKRFEAKDVNIITSARTVAINGMELVEEVELRDGRRIPADVVIGGIGVEPGTKFLKTSGIKLDAPGFIMVDKEFKTSAEDVYAIGDVTSAPLPHWGFEHINIQHFQTAQAHGDLLGYSIMGKAQPRSQVPFFWGLFFFEFGVRFAGSAQGADDVLVRGDIDAMNFSKYYFKNDRVVAVCNAGPAPVAVTFLELFSRKINVTKADVLGNEENDWSSWLK